jgi:DNA invertase Pin-like site-specific DNA recombinase
MSRSTKRRVAVTAGAATVLPLSRTRTLLVARESSTSDLPLLENLLIQTVDHFHSLDGREEIRRAGVAPLARPSDFPGGRKIGKSATPTAVYWAKSTLVMLSQGSAASSNERGENEFTNNLIDLIDEHKPEQIVVATLSRLIRSSLFEGRLLEAIQRNRVQRVVSRELEIDFTSEIGLLLWKLFGAFAAMERNAIVMRLALGQIVRAEKGIWPWAPAALPLGWSLDADKKVALDADAASVVHSLVGWMGEGITNSEIARRLAALGVSPPLLNSEGRWLCLPGGPKEGVEARFHWRGERGAISNLYGMLEAWESGEYLVQRSVGVHATSLAGLPVLDASDGSRFVDIRVPLPLPEGGFATADMFERAREERERKARQTGRPLDARQLPLLDGMNRAFEQEGGTVLLSSHKGWLAGEGGSVYALREWIPDAEVASMPLLASMVPSELHQSLASAAVEHLRNGALLERVDGAPDFAEATRTPLAYEELHWKQQRVAERLAAVDDEYRRTLRAAALAPTAEMQADLLQMAAALQSDKDAAEQEVTALQVERDQVAAPVPVWVAGDLIAHVLAGLANTDQAVPGPVAAAISELITDLQFNINAEDCTFSFSLRLPVDDGWAAFGPISGSVRNRVADRTLARAQVVERLRERTATWMTRDIAFSDLAGTQGRSGETQRFRVAEDLAALGLPPNSARLMTRLPVLDARRTIWAALNQESSPADVSPEFARHLVGTYLDPALTTKRWLGRQVEAEEYVQLLRSNGGSLSRQEVREFRDTTGKRPEIFVRGERAVAVGPRRSGCFNSNCGSRDCRNCGPVTLVICPHCNGWADHVLRVPECPPGLLCSTCRRMPVPDSPEFPQAYLRVNSAFDDEWTAAMLPDLATSRQQTRGASADLLLRRRAMAVGLTPPLRGSVPKALAADIRRRESRAAEVALVLAGATVPADERDLHFENADSELWNRRAALHGVEYENDLDDDVKIALTELEWHMHQSLGLESAEQPRFSQLTADGAPAEWRTRALAASVQVPARGPLSTATRVEIFVSERNASLSDLVLAAHEALPDAVARARVGSGRRSCGRRSRRPAAAGCTSSRWPRARSSRGSSTSRAGRC